MPGGAVVTGAQLRAFMWGGNLAGEAWLRSLPETLARICEKWAIRLEPDLPRLSMNLVMFGESEIVGPVVLKTSPPHEEVTAEIGMIQAMQGRGYPRLIDSSIDEGWSVQQRIMPGTTLQTLWEQNKISDEDATDVFADMLARGPVLAPENSPFLEMDRWLRDLFRYQRVFGGGSGKLPHEAVTLAVHLATEMLASPRERVLLHGDLQHNNILKNEDGGWTVIDPKGVVGDRAFEIGAWLYNPIGFHKRPDVQPMTDRRLTQLSNRLGIERLHLWKWGLIACVLSDCWTLLDSDSTEEPWALPITRSLLAMPERDSVHQAN